MSYYNLNIREEATSFRYIEYLRKSEDNEDRQIRSIPRQLDDLSEVIERFKIQNNIHKVFKETKSAFKLGRPYFEEMMQMIENGEANAVIVWHPNRIARNYEDGGRFVQLISEGKLKLVISLFGIFGDQPRDKSSLMDEFTKATEDSDYKSLAVISGYKRKLKEGYVPSGRLPEGYVHSKKGNSDEMINDIDEDRFNTLRKAVELILKGTHTPMEAYYVLRDKWHYTTRKTKRMGGKPIAKSTWYKILTNPIYSGDLSGRKNAIDGQKSAFKPLYSFEERDKLQIILGGKGKPRMSKHQFAFKKSLKCGECGGTIITDEHWQIICSECKTKFHKGKTTTKCKECGIPIENMRKPKILHYIHYRCYKRTNPKCSQGSISLDVLEQQIDAELKKYEIPETFKNWAIEYLNELSDTEVKDRELIRRNAKKAYDDCVKKLDNLLGLKISPQNINGSVISDEEYTSRRKLLMDEKEQLHSKLNDTNQRINNWLELSENTFNFACYARYWFANGDIKLKTEILDALGSNLVIMDKNLQISGLKHWFLIEKGKKDLVVLAKKFEPVKWLELLGQKDLPDVFRTNWLPSRDSNPDFRIQSAACYHYTTGQRTPVFYHNMNIYLWYIG